MARRSTAVTTPRLVARVQDNGLTFEQRGMNLTCDQHHLNVPLEVTDLPLNQKRRFRHVCAGCAYQKGYADGLAAAKEALNEAQDDHRHRE